jgi:hypothetical protein
MRKSVISSFILLVLSVFCTAPLYAPPLPPNPQSPIDGGAGFLLAAGLIYGIRKYYKSRKPG